jgi:hypothetical protein
LSHAGEINQFSQLSRVLISGSKRIQEAFLLLSNFMHQARSNNFLHLLAALILYATVIIYQGYQYGQSDQSQILPVLHAQDHPSSYPNDHYIKAFLQSDVNERTMFHFLLHHAGYANPWAVISWHALFSVTLILAWIFIASFYIRNNALRWICIGLILTIGFHTSTGSNEIYYNQLIPSLPAKALASWGIYFWLRKWYWPWSVLLILAGYLQPLVGLQVFIICSGALIMHHWFVKEKLSIPWKPGFVYMLATLPWIIILMIHNGGHTDPKGFMDIIEFRLSHHFFASAFSSFDIILLMLFCTAGIYFYRDQTRWLILLAIGGCILYEIFVELLGSAVILYSQWWKVTIWVESFAFIAICAFLEEKLKMKRLFAKYSIILPILLLAAIAFYRLSGMFGPSPVYMAPLSNSASDEVDISIKAFHRTPENAIFIIPPELSAFRWYSRRSTYVDYKAMLHQEAFLREWYQRLFQAYPVSQNENMTGKKFLLEASNTMKDPDDILIREWKSLGVTHFIARPSAVSTAELIDSNKNYAIYKILP